MMTDTDLKKLTLTRAAAMIRRKEISPVELTEAVLRRTQALNDRMRAFITITAETAIERARHAERELLAGNEVGPLHGVPISLKDLYDTKGIRTTAGSRVFENRVPTDDASVVGNLYSAGAVLIGKANLHEFAYGVTTVNPHFG